MTSFMKACNSNILIIPGWQSKSPRQDIYMYTSYSFTEGTAVGMAKWYLSRKAAGSLGGALAAFSITPWCM